jgi:DNA invertase Pin-like site-specific DNA recombinase
MNIAPEVDAAIEAGRHEAHMIVDRSFDSLRERLTSAIPARTGIFNYKDPTDEDCRDPRNKNGPNMSPVGLELLFRLLDKGAGYNSAARKFSITQSAVKNRKKNWVESGGQNRTKMFIPYLDTVA